MILNDSKNNAYLADVNGEALYYFGSDIKSTKPADPQSKCAGQCLTLWPIFDETQAIAPSLLELEYFKEFTRSDGTTQLAYKGSPLYF